MVTNINKEDVMAKESKHRRDERKKPTLSLKEKRAKKHEKKRHKEEHHITGSEHIVE